MKIRLTNDAKSMPDRCDGCAVRDARCDMRAAGAPRMRCTGAHGAAVGRHDTSCRIQIHRVEEPRANGVRFRNEGCRATAQSALEARSPPAPRRGRLDVDGRCLRQRLGVLALAMKKQESQWWDGQTDRVVVAVRRVVARRRRGPGCRCCCRRRRRRRCSAARSRAAARHAEPIVVADGREVDDGDADGVGVGRRGGRTR